VSTAVPAATYGAARRRPRRLTVLTATLYESRSLISAACGYIVIIGLLVGLLLPAFKTLNLQAYLTGSVAALVGGAPLGPNTPLFAVFMALELYGSFFMLLFGGVLAYATGASIARPISRVRLYLEKWAAMLLAGGIIIAISLLTAYACTRVFNNATLHWRWFLLANLDVAVMLFLVVGMGMLLSAVTSGGRAGGGSAVLVVVFWYLCQTFGTAGERLRFLKYLGPYYYAPSSQVITTEQWTDPWKLLVPVAAGLLLGVAGLVYFQRRDIAG
jgi:hypothetical protein